MQFVIIMFSFIDDLNMTIVNIVCFVISFILMIILISMEENNTVFTVLTLLFTAFTAGLNYHYISTEYLNSALDSDPSGIYNSNVKYENAEDGFNNDPDKDVTEQSSQSSEEPL